MIQPAQALDASNKAALTKSASADAAGSGVHEALQAADGAAPASGQDHGSVGAKRGRRAGLAITPPSAVEVLGLPVSHEACHAIPQQTGLWLVHAARPQSKFLRNCSILKFALGAPAAGHFG